MQSKKLFSIIIAGTLAATLFSACSTYPDRANKLRNACNEQNYEQAVKLANDQVKSASENDKLQWQLDYANCLRLNNDLKNASLTWDDAEKTFNYWDEKADVLISQEIAAGISNLSALPYRGHNIDRIMLHTFRALTLLQLNDVPAARTALNAAYREQQLAADRNAKQIEKAKADAKKNKVDQHALDEQNRIIDKRLIADSQNDFQFDVYADYVNPFTTWLYGIYFLHAATDAGDIERSRNALSRVDKMVPNNPAIEADLKLIANGAKLDVPVTYVIYEYGKIANLREWRLDLLLPIAGTLAPSSIALPRVNCPKFDKKTSHAHNYEIPQMSANGNTANLVCDMNRVWVTEFHNGYPSIIFRTLTAAFTKTAVSVAANAVAKESGNDLAYLATLVGTSIYTLGSSGADLRVWQTLPRSFSITRMPTPNDKKIKLNIAGHESTIDVPDAKVAVVYVVLESFMRPPQVRTFVLKTK